MEMDFGHLGLTWDAATRSRRRTWVFSGRLRHCRRAYREVVFDQKQETFFACHMHAFEWFGGGHRRVVRGPVGEPRLGVCRIQAASNPYAGKSQPIVETRTRHSRKFRLNRAKGDVCCPHLTAKRDQSDRLLARARAALRVPDFALSAAPSGTQRRRRGGYQVRQAQLPAAVPRGREGTRARHPRRRRAG